MPHQSVLSWAVLWLFGATCDNFVKKAVLLFLSIELLKMPQEVHWGLELTLSVQDTCTFETKVHKESLQFI